MGRPKKAQTKAQDNAATFASMLDKMPPEVLLAGILGGIATKGGLTPPLTRMMQAIATGGASDIAQDYATLVLKTASPAYYVGKSVYDQLNWMYIVVTGKHPDGSDVSESEKQSNVAISALMAGGAAEYMIYMTLAKNPEFQKRAFDMMTGVGAGASAILSKV